MDFHQLRYFLEAARQEHLGRAARALGISQSALSHSVAALEADLGIPLFLREGRRVFLSDQGRLLLDRGEKLLQEKRALESELRSSSKDLQGTLRVAAPVALNAHFVGPVWAKLSNAHPRLQAEISSLRSIEIVPKVISGEIDIGVCFGAQAHPLLTDSLLATRKLVVAVSRESRESGPKSLNGIIEVLSKLPAALPRGLLGFGLGETHPFFERYNIQPKVALLCDHYEVAIAFICQKRAWTLLPDWIADRQKLVLEAVYPMKIFEPLPITAIWPRARPGSQSGRLLVKQLQTALARR